MLEYFSGLLYDLLPMNEMANYRAKEFNLPVNVWVDGPRNLKHHKRVKFQNNYSERFDYNNLFSITISDNPEVCKTLTKLKVSNKDIEKLKDWIILNKEVLEKYANGELSTKELDTQLKPYEE